MVYTLSYTVFKMIIQYISNMESAFQTIDFFLNKNLFFLSTRVCNKFLTINLQSFKTNPSLSFHFIPNLVKLKRKKKNQYFGKFHLIYEYRWVVNKTQQVWYLTQCSHSNCQFSVTDSKVIILERIWLKPLGLQCFYHGNILLPDRVILIPWFWW